jgi:hypothetical protein
MSDAGSLQLLVYALIVFFSVVLGGMVLYTWVDGKRAADKQVKQHTPGDWGLPWDDD